MSAEGNVVDLDGSGSMEETPVKIEPTSAAPSVPISPEPIPVSSTLGVTGKSIPDQGEEDLLAKSLGGGEENKEEIKPVQEGNKKIKPEITDKARASLNSDEFRVNQFIFGKYNPEEIRKALISVYPTEEEQEKASKDPTSFFRFLVDAARSGFGTNGMQSYIDVLKQEINGKPVTDNLAAQNDDSLSSLKDSFKTEVKHSSVDLTADEARKAFMGRINGYRRVKLLNSGFWVALRRPYIHELQDIFDIVDMEQKEIGYTIGPHFALLADMYVKKTFLETLIKFRLIVDSNLENIYEDGVFISALSFHDYEPLIHGLLALMSRSGFRSRVVCPECGLVTVLENIDIGSAKYVNRNLLSPKVFEYWDTKKKPDGSPIGKRTVQDCLNYQKNILGFNYYYVDKFNDVDIGIEYRVPTMKRYFEVGEYLFTQMRDTINERSTSDKNRRQLIFANMAAHIYHMMAPWVSKIEEIENGQVMMRTDDAATIIQLFDTTAQDGSEKAFMEMHKFLAESKISYIGTFALECPKCKARPDVGLKNQFYPLEVQTIFFGQLYRLLPAELTQTEQSQ